MLKDFLHKFFLFLCLLSLTLTFFSPSYYDTTYNYFIFSIYVIQLFVFFKLKKKTSYWDFDILFLIVFSLASYAYPLLIYTPSDPFLPFFQLPFKTNNISKAVGLSSIAATAYMLGSLCKKNTHSKSYRKVEVNTNFLVLLVLLFSLIFIAAGGITYYQAMYDKKIEVVPSGLILQAQALLQACSIAAISIEFYNININNKKANKLLFLVLFLVAFIMLYAGNRTLAMQLILPITFFVAFRYIRITKI